MPDTNNATFPLHVLWAKLVLVLDVVRPELRLLDVRPLESSIKKYSELGRVDLTGDPGWPGGIPLHLGEDQVPGHKGGLRHHLSAAVTVPY